MDLAAIAVYLILYPFNDNVTRMNKIMAIGLSVLAIGFIVSGVGTLSGSVWSFSNPFAKGGPYSYNVGIAGLIIVLAGIYIITTNKANE